MNNPVVAITGATGFVGSSLADYLAGNGFYIVALTRSFVEGYEHRHYDLEHSVPEGLLSGIDILIHCAFIPLEKNEKAGELNYEGTKNLLLEARRSGVRKKIFFSSVSAHEDALSQYGISKIRTEQFFQLHDVVLQSSLIIGHGGLFRRLLDHTLSLGLVPLLKKGCQPMQVIALDDVLQSVLTIITNDLSGRFILANNDHITYRQFFSTISNVYQKRLVFVPISPRLLKAVTTMTSFFGIKMPFTRENVNGLQELKSFDPARSLHDLKLIPLTFEETLLELRSGRKCGPTRTSV